MDLSGKVTVILPEQSGVSSKTGNEWKRYSFVIETRGEYPRHCVFTVFGEDTWRNLGIVLGGEYCVSFDIDAREHNGKWYNDVKAWKAVRLDVAAQPSASPSPSAPVAAPAAGGSVPTASSGEVSDLPF